MRLETESLLEVPRHVTPPHLEMTWPAVREGLHKILLGYAVLLGAGLLTALAVVFVTVEVVQGKVLDAVIDAALLLYFGMGIIFLMGLWSLLLVIGGKLRCAINVPDRCGAKWMIFFSIVCFCVTPALDLLSNLLPSKVPPEKVMEVMRDSPLFQGKVPIAKPGNPDGVVKTFNHLRDFAVSMMILDGRAWVALGAHLASLLSVAFFVLFLHAVARCFHERAARLLAELYLVFMAALVGGSYYLFFNPPEWTDKLGPLMLVLAMGWLISLMWYVLLIINTSILIQRNLAWRDLALRLERE
jgi:hypothetical protein